MTRESVPDDRFERALRDLLAELAPSSAPAHVHEAVAHVPRSRPGGGGAAGRLGRRPLFAALGAAAATLLLVAAVLVTIGHPFSLGGEGDGTGPGGASPTALTTPAPMRDEYQVLPRGSVQPTSADLTAIATIVSHRLQSQGVEAPDVSVVPPDRIVVLLPAADPDRVDLLRRVIGTTGRLDFVPLGSSPAQQDEQLPDSMLSQPCDASHTVDCVLFSGDQIAAASIGTDQTAQRTIDLTLKDASARLFADYTAGHVGDYFAMVLDGKVITAPVINEAIPGGQVQISQNGLGGYPLADAQNLVTIIQSGKLPFPLREVAFGP